MLTRVVESVSLAVSLVGDDQLVFGVLVLSGPGKSYLSHVTKLTSSVVETTYRPMRPNVGMRKNEIATRFEQLRVKNIP